MPTDVIYFPKRLGELFVIHYFIELPSSQYTPHSPYCVYVLHRTRILEANHISSGPLIAVGGLQHVLEITGVSEASDGWFRHHYHLHLWSVPSWSTTTGSWSVCLWSLPYWDIEACGICGELCALCFRLLSRWGRNYELQAMPRKDDNCALGSCNSLRLCLYGRYNRCQPNTFQGMCGLCWGLVLPWWWNTRPAEVWPEWDCGSRSPIGLLQHTGSTDEHVQVSHATLSRRSPWHLPRRPGRPNMCWMPWKHILGRRCLCCLWSLRESLLDCWYHCSLPPDDYVLLHHQHRLCGPGVSERVRRNKHGLDFRLCPELGNFGSCAGQGLRIG